MRVLILANGGVISPSWFATLHEAGDYIICADGGYHQAERLSITPDEVMGDFDSCPQEQIVCERVKVFPTKKDYTDTELAIRRAMELLPEEIILLGCIGTRMDHTLANLYLLKAIAQEGIKGVLMDEHNTIYYCKDTLVLKGKKGQILSILPMTPECTGVYTQGLYYPLYHESIYQHTARSVSNVVTEDIAAITIESGEVLVMLTRD